MLVPAAAGAFTQQQKRRPPPARRRPAWSSLRLVSCCRPWLCGSMRRRTYKRRRASGGVGGGSGATRRATRSGVLFLGRRRAATSFKCVAALRLLRFERLEAPNPHDEREGRLPRARGRGVSGGLVSVSESRRPPTGARRCVSLTALCAANRIGGAERQRGSPNKRARQTPCPRRARRARRRTRK